jgi:hypothetical protein
MTRNAHVRWVLESPWHPSPVPLIIDALPRLALSFTALDSPLLLSHHHHSKS